jgi:uncharacterized lipoprotein NlpE involved in copper resistance
MKKIIFVVSMMAASALVLSSCKPKNASKEQNNETPELVGITDSSSREMLDWEGAYDGTIPCADCEGIHVHLVLHSNDTYNLHYHYLGKTATSPDSFSGAVTWSESGDRITLDIQGWPPYYVVGENKLIQLDMEGNYITGELADRYVLTKASGAE